jgi:geranylgeranyl diphosphate synthase type II
MYNQDELKKIVNKALANFAFNTESEKLIDPVKYILSIGGKRLRPVLALMAYNLFKDKIDDAVLPVTGLEIFHNFTLVHDDIMDNAGLRRGFATVHNKWNINQAILSGDVMAFITNECFLLTPTPIFHQVFRMFNKAAIDVCIGQQIDMDYERTLIVSQTEYLRMIELKTASLIAASLRIGGVFGSAGNDDSELLHSFGKYLGLAFQIQDDLLDTYGNSKIFGKTQGGDILAGKKTFLYVKAMEVSNSEQKKQLQKEFLDSGSEPDAKVKAVTEIYDRLNMKTIASSLVYEYINNALECLDKIKVSPERKEELALLTESLSARDH